MQHDNRIAIVTEFPVDDVMQRLATATPAAPAHMSDQHNNRIAAIDLCFVHTEMQCQQRLAAATPATPACMLGQHNNRMAVIDRAQYNATPAMPGCCNASHTCTHVGSTKTG
jgi:hypothetical protein